MHSKNVFLQKYPRAVWPQHILAKHI